MLKRVCDRCGAIVDDNDPQLRIDINHDKYDIKDLCMKCYLSFKAYVDNVNYIVVDKAFLSEVNTEEGED